MALPEAIAATLRADGEAGGPWRGNTHSAKAVLYLRVAMSAIRSPSKVRTQAGGHGLHMHTKLATTELKHGSSCLHRGGSCDMPA